MEFDRPKGIYQQIADHVCRRILEREWPPGERIPSVREMAVTMGVNPNTVARSYQALLDGVIIENRRGISYFVSPSAQEKIMNEMRREFIEDELPRLFDTMRKIGMEMDELIELYNDYVEEAGK